MANNQYKLRPLGGKRPEKPLIVELDTDLDDIASDNKDLNQTITQIRDQHIIESNTSVIDEADSEMTDAEMQTQDEDRRRSKQTKTNKKNYKTVLVLRTLFILFTYRTI